jgi:predicted small lipoprotein YifL
VGQEERIARFHAKMPAPARALTMSPFVFRLVPMILVLAFALQGCGVKGPLYLPDKPATDSRKSSSQETK